MGERYATAEPISNIRQRFPHIAEQEKLGGRHAIWMGGDPPLTNIDLAVREQLAKVIVSSAVAKAELKHHAF
jgi:hypothetical protein